MYLYFKIWPDIVIINLYFSECCKTLLINWEGAEARPDKYVNQFSSTKYYGHPKFSVGEVDTNSLYFKNGKWLIIEGDFGQVVSISNTSPKCPEMVQSWSTKPDATGGFRLVKGKIRCAVEDQAPERLQ